MYVLGWWVDLWPWRWKPSLYLKQKNTIIFYLSFTIQVMKHKGSFRWPFSQGSDAFHRCKQAQTFCCIVCTVMLHLSQNKEGQMDWTLTMLSYFPIFCRYCVLSKCRPSYDMYEDQAATIVFCMGVRPSQVCPMHSKETTQFIKSEKEILLYFMRMSVVFKSWFHCDNCQQYNN